MKEETIKKAVREGYARIAKGDNSCCAPVNSCCGNRRLAQTISKRIGYSEKELKEVPEGANLGLGCGNPIAFSSLKEGETVLDLGSGAGFDCFLAANEVGNKGRVIGVDMTAEMIERAKENGRKSKYKNVEFRLGEIENLPVADSSIDIVISNCVINLSPDKRKVFLEVFRVLKPGGRLMISDIVLLKELPGYVKDSIEAYIGCLSGAIMRNEYLGAMQAAGFQKVRIIDETSLSIDCMANDPTVKLIIKNLNLSPDKTEEIASSVASIKVYAVKPNGSV
ncbi:arsenite S-adenosylmethyltransferase [Candidatus Aerophobetes bacterium Ae_b3a]|nr:MAG: arsenite S-adenosylmethyltransferase [Candidatus Aerophobetes bacterium Ae_b3a]